MVAGYIEQASVQLTASENISTALKKVQASINETMSRAMTIGPRMSTAFMAVDKSIGSVTKSFTGMTTAVGGVGRTFTSVGGAMQRVSAGISKTINNVSAAVGEMGRSLSQVGSSVQGLGTKLTIGGGAGAGLFGRSLFKSADMAESMNRFRALFGEQADAAERFSERLAKSVRRSKFEIVNGMSDFGGLALGLGMSTEKARELSQELVSLAVDFGSFANLHTDDAIIKLLAALSGEIMPVKRYGINISETALKMRGLKDSASETAKTLERMKIIRETLGRQGAIGDATRTAYSAANSFKAFLSSIVDLDIALGSAIEAPMTAIVNRMVQAVGAATAWAAANPRLVATLATTTAAVLGLGVALTFSSFALAAISTAITALAGVMGVLAAPIGLVIIGLAKLTAHLMQNTETGRAVWSALSGGIKQVYSDLSQLISLVAAGQIEQALLLVSTRAAGAKVAIDNAVASVTSWVNANWAAIQQTGTVIAKILTCVFAFRVAAVAVGAAGVAVTLFGTLVSAAMTVASAAVTAFGAIVTGVTATLAFIATPLGVITAALAAATAGFLAFSDSGQAAVGAVSSAFRGMGDSFGHAVQLIREGRLIDALKVVTTGAAVVWHDFVSGIRVAWIKVAGAVEAVWFSLGQNIIGAIMWYIGDVEKVINKSIDEINWWLKGITHIDPIKMSVTDDALSEYWKMSRKQMDEIQDRVQQQIAAAEAPAKAARKAWEEARAEVDKTSESIAKAADQEKLKAFLEKGLNFAFGKIKDYATDYLQPKTNPVGPAMQAAPAGPFAKFAPPPAQDMKERVQQSLTALDMRSREGMQALVDAVNNRSVMSGVEDRLDKAVAAIEKQPEQNGAAFKAALDQIAVADMSGKNPGN